MVMSWEGYQGGRCAEETGREPSNFKEYGLDWAPCGVADPLRTAGIRQAASWEDSKS